MSSRQSLWAWLLVLMFLVTALPVVAQETDPSTISDDQVNAVAHEMYCPVCENVPLDVCPTAACDQWREEIRILLAEGKTKDEIQTTFVARYGDRVLGTPEDPTLRTLSLVTPWLVGIVALAGASLVIWRWRKSRLLPAASTTLSEPHSEDEYRDRLERDLMARR